MPPGLGPHGTRNFSLPINSSVVHSDQNPQLGFPRPSTEVSRARAAAAAAAREEQVKKDRRRRVCTYYAHAVVIFHAFGIPLSSGLILEYYYNTLFPTTPLKNLSLIFGIQWVGIFAMSLLTSVVCKWKHWRWAYFAVLLLVLLCHGVLARGVKPWTLSLGIHALIGLCLGFLRSLSVRCLATHYNDDFTQASMQSGAAAMIGGLVYSLVAWHYLRTENHKGLGWANFSIVALTLIPTLFGLYQATPQDEPGSYKPKRGNLAPKLRHRKSTQGVHTSIESKYTQTNPVLTFAGDYCFLVGYFVVYAFLFVWPTFFPLLICSRPIYDFPDDAAYLLFGMFGAGTLSAAFFARSWPRQGLGVMNTCTAAAIFAGSLIVGAACFRTHLAWTIFAVLYGLCLGSLVALYAKVFNLMQKYWAKRAMYPMGLGACAFGGISVSDVILQNLGGSSTALIVLGFLMIAGGVLLAAGRWLRYPTRYVVI